ncbi:cation-translocating P-type ATPase [Levilactobacillus bambusae]|uniref:Haloacid dehalogenase n=1 Tax=Levilactobacillus bambusae TaxID=2024736 RepID=A0A2V1MZ11_9LACO|nr:cation-transporting P-type ATPase [Levilactobacillus bambusae]PWF99329.1 haloacid dehalogenase [Levilactobacillus bambusae]
MTQYATNDQLAQMPVDQFYQQMGSSPAGLPTTEADQRLTTDGPNTIQQGKRTSNFKAFIKNFTSLMAILLWVSGIIAILAGMLELGIAIWAVNVINGVFSFWQEHAAKKATDALKELLPTYTTVVRDGKTVQINANDLVPGDVFNIQTGNRISADARIVQCESLQVDESALSGESQLVSKQVAYHKGSGKYDEANLVYAGTIAAQGNAVAVAIQTGMKTEFGQIAALTEGEKKVASPLEIELNRLTREISVIGMLIGVAFFIAAILVVHTPVAKAFIFALGMIVAFIPEGLLPTVTLSLANGVQGMSKHHALVKELNSVETLGETTVICSDKTGTLTQNQMTIEHIWLPGQQYDVTGEGYENNGQIKRGNQPVAFGQNADLDLLLRASFLDNDTQVEAPKDAQHGPKIMGSPTEAALQILVAKAGMKTHEIQSTNPRVKEFGFDSNRKRMSTVNQATDGTKTLYTKGALDGILALCDTILVQGRVRPMTDQDKTQIEQANQAFATQGLRSLAVAYRSVTDSEDLNQTADQLEHHLTFIGLTVMSDPPRPEVYEAVKRCHTADIRIIMVTGDGPTTAKSVAVKIGINGENVRIITGDELAQMSDSDLETAVKGDVLFARVAPEQKYRIVKANKANGEIVASTGDGVNDAPALKQADIGIAMGQTGTDVAKEAADMILTDDNFASIVAAIQEGRTVYADIQKFLLYILNSNVPEAVPSILYLFSGGLIPLPLTVMQILTVDLGTDMMPALGLGSEKSEPGIMDQPPRPRNAHLLNRRIILKAFAWYGLISSVISTAAYFLVNYRYGGWPHQALASSGSVYLQATTMTLAAIVFCQIAMAENCRTKLVSVFKIGLFSNHRINFGIIFEVCLLALIIYVPILQGIFNTTGLTTLDWVVLATIPIPVFLVEELRKFMVRRHLSREGKSPAAVK